jgi:hypothetical protein
VEHTTHLFERWVPKARECRAIIIGEHVTATAITAGSPAAYVDYPHRLHLRVLRTRHPA